MKLSDRKKYYVIGLYCSIVVWVILRNAFSIILFDSGLELAKSRNCMRFGRWQWRSNHYFKSLRLDSVENRHRGTQKVLILPHSLPLDSQPFFTSLSPDDQQRRPSTRCLAGGAQRQLLFIDFSSSSPFTISLQQLDVPGFSNFPASCDLSTHDSVSEGLV